MDLKLLWDLVLTAFAGLVTLNWRGMVKDIRDQNERITQLALKAITREELDKKFEEIKNERREMHEEQKAMLKEISTRLENAPILLERLNETRRVVYRIGRWKHKTIDPLIPGEIHRLNDRITRLEEEYEHLRRFCQARQ